MGERIILYDIDGILSLSVETVAAEVNKRHGTNFSPEDFTSWRWIYQEMLKVKGNKEEAERAERIWLEPEVLREAAPDPEAVAISRRLHDRGWEQVVATSRESASQRVTLAWFEEHYPWISPKRIYIRENGDGRSGDEFKLAVHREVKPMISVDDSGQTVRFLMKNLWFPDPIPVILRLMTRPWNQEGFDDLKEVRAGTWKEIEDLTHDRFKIGGYIKDED